jgi:serine/threonine protein kinase/Tol biopolymer transport system component
MTGESIAHYRVGAKLGAGGMGEVYRATDTKLNRDVAVKVLPEAFASDRERMGRFQREAQVLASLSHPAIASIFGLEESAGRRALVMELVEGEDLSMRIARGPIPREEALRYALAIAEGLESAHERGVIHRDLKPANIKITPDGRVKILDFGLAKALEGSPAATSDPSQSPTLSLAATQAGIILGTAAYMSPEQASGRVADKRADVWSFGVVLFEMLTGRRLFEGETVSHTLADVLRADIDWARLPADTPGAIKRLLSRCLERDPKRRLRDIGEARIAIEEQLAGLTSSSASTAAAPSVSSALPAPRSSSRIPWAIAAAALVAAAAVSVLWLTAGSDGPVTRLHADVKIHDVPLWTQIGSSIELSPDGSRVAYVTDSALMIRPLDQLTATTLLEGARGISAPYHPFFSPDGEWIAYVTTSELMKVPVSGGTPMRLCAVDRSRGGTWTPDGTIVFAPSPNTGLFRVPATGGDPQPLTTLDAAAGEATHRWPQVLPGGQAILFTTHTQITGNFDDAAIDVVRLDTGERKRVLSGGSFGRYVPSGHLVYVNRGTLFAVPFDLGRLETTGNPAPVVQNVTSNVEEGAAQFTFATTGLMAYVRGGPLIPRYPIVWVDRDGRTSRLLDEEGTYANPRLSPDGTQLSLTVLRDGNWDIWVYDLAREVSTRLTFDEGSDTEQLWSPDGRSLIYSSTREGADSLFRKSADGSGEAEQVGKFQNPMWGSSWSVDGSYVLFTTTNPSLDVGILELGQEPKLLLSTPFSEVDAAISPDGRWIAYSSDESGRTEVYVRSFEEGGGRWQISDSGGGYARWSGDGRELFYRTDDGVMVASIESAGDGLRTSRPRQLFAGAFRGGVGGTTVGGSTFADYEVSRDGQRFVMFPVAATTEESRAGLITLVSPWFEDLKNTFAPRR